MTPVVERLMVRGLWGMAVEDRIDDTLEGPPEERRRRWWIALVIVCVIIAAVVIVRARRHEAPKPASAASRPIPVSTVQVSKGDLNIYVTGLGTVTAFNVVTVRTRVDGELQRFYFGEGQIVKAGQLLATIDPRPFQVQLVQAEGALARDEALLANARVDLERYRVLWQEDSIPKQQLDTQEALVKQYEGAVVTDRGLIDSAKLQIAYSRITAPLTGRIGLQQVDPGNIVHAADANGLAVITQLQPISVLFSIPEDSLPVIMGNLKARKRMTVDVFNRDLSSRLASGGLETVDNQIDVTTGTVRLKANFDNRDNALFPNQFVNARLLVDVRRGVTIVPAAAIQRGPQGTYVYVIRPDRTAIMRPVVIGQVQDDRASMRSGIAPGEIVVVNGAERLREGARVEIRQPDGTRTAAGQAAQGRTNGRAGTGSPSQ